MPVEKCLPHSGHCSAPGPESVERGESAATGKDSGSWYGSARRPLGGERRPDEAFVKSCEARRLELEGVGRIMPAGEKG